LLSVNNSCHSRHHGWQQPLVGTVLRPFNYHVDMVCNSYQWKLIW
jgi:hypothetical protein